METAAPVVSAFLFLVAVALGLALARARRETAAAAPAPGANVAAVQRVLLPARPPVVDGVRVSWSHVAASGEGGGSDFHDAFFLDDGALAITIGAAAGHGLTAVVATNTVRQALRCALIDGARPADALRRTNRVLLRSENPGIVAALVGIIDPATLQFRYASAGHPLPLLATADDACVALPGGGSGIALGALPHHVTSEDLVAIPVDGLLAFYSDGCVVESDERTVGAQALADALVEARKLAPSKPALAIDRAIFGERARAADATIITVAPEPTLAHLDLRLPAEPPSAALARTALRRFLAATALSERRAFDAVVAAGEAVANAIEHAYDRRPNQTFVLRGRYEDKRCTIVVEDTGSWHEGTPVNSRGRGILMMRELSDTFEISRSTSGTSVLLAFLTINRIADVSLAVT